MVAFLERRVGEGARGGGGAGGWARAVFSLAGMGGTVGRAWGCLQDALAVGECVTDEEYGDTPQGQHLKPSWNHQRCVDGGKPDILPKFESLSREK